jgi:hypothetical protein
MRGRLVDKTIGIVKRDMFARDDMLMPFITGSIQDYRYNP